MLVSIIVRSMGRPELAHALRSAAAQDYAPLDIIVVDATGGHHPPLPDIPLMPGHAIRMVGTGERLARARAGNVGLDAVRGEFFSFLDDDDAYEPHCVSTLLAVAQQNPRASVVYGRASIIASDGSVERIAGRPFNQALMYYGPLAPPTTSLIRRSVLDRGCRFDEAFDVCEDRDFLAQIAQFSPFVHVPVPVYRYHPTLGTSGTGSGANRDGGNTAFFESRFRAKWAGPRALHIERCTRWSRRAVRLYASGDGRGAKAAFDRALAEYPEDPSAQNGLARIELDEGDLESAELRARNALDVDPTIGEFRLTLAEILVQKGDVELALREALAARADARHFAAADSLIARLRAQSPATAIAPLASPASTSPASLSRIGPCHCGSGRKFKHCCGRLQYAVPAAARSPADGEILRAWNDYLRGEATVAHLRANAQNAGSLTSSEMARRAGDICDAMGDYLRATVFYRRSLSLADDPFVHQLLEGASSRAFRPLADASAHATLREVATVENAKSAAAGSHRFDVGGGKRSIDILGAFSHVGGAEQRALNLYRMLAPHADVRLWSQNWPPHEAHARRFPILELQGDARRAPSSELLVFANHHLGWDDHAEWLDRAAISRVVICHNLSLPEHLLQCVAHLASRAVPVAINFTFPSRLVREQSKLPGEIEYNPIDTTHFAPVPHPLRERGAMIIGRHSRDDPMKHHPNSPSLYRRVVARGHRIRALGGSTLAAAFAEDPARESIELLAEGTADVKAFLASLDCYLYRTHPQFMETGGTSLFEAMAMEIPIVLFRERCGAAELFASGENGFLVDTEDEALDAIDRLAADPALRAAIGRAARATIVDALRDQRERLLRFYLEDAS